MTAEDDAETEAEKESESLDDELRQMTAAAFLLFFGVPITLFVLCNILIQIFGR